MKNKNTPAEGTSSAKLEAESALRGAACSPSSETPRTDAFAQRLTAAKVPASKTWPHWYDYAAALERELAACHRALMTCDGAMMGKVKPSSVAFKRINEILRPENANVDLPDTAAQDSASPSNNPAVSG